LETLRVEADRLAHLVDNVLQYARLERTTPGNRSERVLLGALVERVERRLADRARASDMHLCIELDGDAAATAVEVDVAAVDQILFNLVDNACKYAAHGADRRIHLTVAVERRFALVQVRDHGPGITSLGRRKLFKPFTKTVQEAARSAPGVGLGLALSRRLAKHLGGRLELARSEAGAVFELRLPTVGPDG
jgi:signal transduction histidine kinase